MGAGEHHMWWTEREIITCGGCMTMMVVEEAGWCVGCDLEVLSVKRGPCENSLPCQGGGGGGVGSTIMKASISRV